MTSCFHLSTPVPMSDLWIGDVGIRVTNLEKSIDFYRKVFDLEEIDRGGDEEGIYVLFRDRRSGQRLELNWYAESSPFWAPFTPGEALDHFEVRVKNVSETLERLKRLGILPATKKLWVNRKATAKLKEDPKFAKLMEQDVWTSRTGHRIAYIQDPDGIFFCLYDHPEEPWEGPIPDHY
jgi:catechol 2,3-dioxygenase-like lactoylglutathione lyase family enzyme